MKQDWLIVAILAGVLYAAFLSIRLRRETIRGNLQRLVIALTVYVIATAYFAQAGWTATQAIIGGVFSGFVADTLFHHKRSRYIPRSERRKVIARFEMETGKEFNPKIHHIHHVIPFSKDGSNTADNLRVVTREENLRRGAQSPWWDLFSR